MGCGWPMYDFHNQHYFSPREKLLGLKASLWYLNVAFSYPFHQRPFLLSETLVPLLEGPHSIFSPLGLKNNRKLLSLHSMMHRNSHFSSLVSLCLHQDSLGTQMHRRATWCHRIPLQPPTCRTIHLKFHYSWSMASSGSTYHSWQVLEREENKTDQTTARKKMS